MGNCAVFYRELRFVIQDELTHCYALMGAYGDCPLGAQGWHHKAFPASKSCIEILDDFKNGVEDPVMWPLNAPGEA